MIKKLTNKKIKDVEKLMLYHFQTEPFHNLHLLFNNGHPLNIRGGTCSDKSLIFLESAKSLGFDAYLHSAFINDKEIHRLIRLEISDRVYFADVGNGWPAIKLFPANREITYECFGMKYRSELREGYLAVYHERNGIESLQMKIAINPRPEADILKDIRSRYSSGISYPFSKSIRFSLIKGESFLFLRGDKLEVYKENDKKIIERDGKLSSFIEKHFELSIPDDYLLPPN